MMGIEAVRSSTPAIVRDSIKKTLNLIINKDEDAVQQYIAEEKRSFITKPFEDVAFP